MKRNEADEMADLSVCSQDNWGIASMGEHVKMILTNMPFDHESQRFWDDWFCENMPEMYSTGEVEEL